MERAAKKTGFCRLLAAFLLVCLLVGSSTAVWASSGKAARIREKYLTGDETQDTYYGVSFDFAKSGKIGKKNTFSGKIVIEKSYFSETGDMFLVLPEVECFMKNGSSAGTLYSKSIILIVKNKKKFEAFFISGGNFYEVGKKVRVKASSKEVTINVKNLPLFAEKSLSRKKAYTLSPTVWFMSGKNQKTKKYIDTVSVTLRAAKKHTCTFKKKHFKYLHAMRSDGYPINVTLVSR